MYYEYSETVKYIKPHRIMAINRAEKEGVISVNIDYDNDKIIEYLEKRIIKNKESYVTEIVKESIKDSLKD